MREIWQTSRTLSQEQAAEIKAAYNGPAATWREVVRKYDLRQVDRTSIICEASNA